MKRKEIRFIILAVIVSFIFGYLMRNVPVPPDCLTQPDNPLCVEK